MVGPAFFAAGVALAAHHPTSPWLALAGFAVWCLSAWRWRSAWLFVLPACLPAAAFGPWTGWVAFDEFDLLVIGALAAGHARSAWIRPDAATGSESETLSLRRRTLLGLALLYATLDLVSMGRALLAAEPSAFGWYDSELDPLNALRVGKSALYALLLLPLLRLECLRSKAKVFRRVGAGMLVGLGIVCLAVLWERAAYPGVLDLSKPYRTVALFWEMHVGGAAIDAYLAMAIPFVVGAVLRARTLLRFCACALLAVLAEYACLTSYSRGLYLALAGSLCVYAVLAARWPIERPATPWRRPASALLVAVLIGQLIAVLGSDSFMRARLERGQHDLRSRLEHWSRGVALLRGAPDWWLGKGMGRLPAELAGTGGPVEMAGRSRVLREGGEAYLELHGPRSSDVLAGRYALSQRVPREALSYRLTLDVRTERPTRLLVAVCEVHLLYEGHCRRAVASIPASGRRWQHLTLVLDEPAPPTTGSALRLAAFSLALGQAGSRIELDNLVLSVDGSSANVLRNGDFSRASAHWYPTAKDYFVPWHIDNLALELLIEQGIVGLIAFALLMAWAFGALLGRRRGAEPAVAQALPVLAASLAGALLVGLVSSVLDMPRVAFLLFFLALLSTQLGRAAGRFRWRWRPAVDERPKA